MAGIDHGCVLHDDRELYLHDPDDLTDFAGLLGYLCLVLYRPTRTGRYAYMPWKCCRCPLEWRWRALINGEASPLLEQGVSI